LSARVIEPDVDDGVSQSLGHRRVVAGDEQTGANCLAVQQDLGEQVALVRVEPLLRLIEEEDRRGANEHHREVEQLLLARGQLVGEPFFEMVDLEQLQDLLGAIVGALSNVAPGGVDQDEVVDQSEVTVGRGCADQRRDRGAGEVVAFVDRRAVQGGLALRGWEGAGEDSQHCGLAAAVGTAQDDTFSRAHVHVGGQQQHCLVDPLADTRCPKHVAGRVARRWYGGAPTSQHGCLPWSPAILSPPHRLRRSNRSPRLTSSR